MPLLIKPVILSLSPTPIQPHNSARFHLILFAYFGRLVSQVRAELVVL